MSADDQLDPDIARVLATERDAPGAPLGSKARVAARLGLGTMGGGGGGASNERARGEGAPRPAPLGTPRSGSGFGLASLAVSFVVGGVVGAGLLATFRPPAERVVYLEHALPSVVPLRTPESESTSRPVVAAPAIATAKASTESAPPVVEPASRDDHSLAREQALLDGARVALGRRDAVSALSATREHERRFPAGKLAEEREAIAIQALVLLGRDADARARADRFRGAHPSSALLPAIDEALKE